MSKEKLMGAVKDMYYDVESLFIEGHTASEIANQLAIPIEYVNDVLSDFGVEPEDADLEYTNLDDIQGDYYGA